LKREGDSPFRHYGYVHSPSPQSTPTFKSDKFITETLPSLRKHECGHWPEARALASWMRKIGSILDNARIFFVQVQKTHNTLFLDK